VASSVTPVLLPDHPIKRRTIVFKSLWNAIKRILGYGSDPYVVVVPPAPKPAPPVDIPVLREDPNINVPPAPPAPPAPQSVDVPVFAEAVAYVNGVECVAGVTAGGFSILHEIPALPEGGTITVEVLEPANVQFMTYPRDGMQYQLTEDDLPGEDHGDIVGKPGSFRTHNRSIHYRQLTTSGPCKITMPLEKKKTGEPLTIVKVAIKPLDGRPLATIWAQVFVGSE
jgi:hypothetical protein